MSVRNSLTALIDVALLEIDNVIEMSKFYSAESEPIVSTKSVLILLKQEVHSNPNKINTRVLRAMHDLGMSAYKEFENTSLEEALNKLVAALYHQIPKYKSLQPLRKDFSKGDPI